jgi:nucleoside-triphosphatase THEP1
MRRRFDFCHFLVYLVAMVLLLTGPVHAGKTRLLQDLVVELKREGICLDGYLSPAVFKNGEPFGYDLLDLKKEVRFPFLRRKGRPGWEKVGPHFFVPGGLRQAKRKILLRRENEFLIVDEVGPLEVRGGGVRAALEPILSGRSAGCLLVVRRAVLDEFQGILGQAPLKVFDVNDPGAAGAIKNEIREIARDLNRRPLRSHVREGHGR